MKKIQVPVLGGMRKVIRPDSNITVGTTIAELGAGTITLAQLAAIITQIQAQQSNNGGGNIGGGDTAFLTPGPGLSGGGPLLGNVGIRLTAPIPWGLDDGGGGGDGDPGPPGVAGKAGAAGTQGPQGVATFLEAEPGEDGLWAIPGPQGLAGTAGTNGTQGPAGPAVFLEAEAGEDGLWAIPGPQGLTGATGATGPQGPSGSGSGGGGAGMMLIPEEAWPDEEIFRSVPSGVGPLAVNGLLTVNGQQLTLSGNQTNVTTLSFGTGTFPLGTLAQISFTPQASGQLQLKAEAVAIYTGIGAGGPTQFLGVSSAGTISASGNMTISTTTGVALTITNTTTNGLLMNAGAGSSATYAVLVTANGVQAFGIFGDGGVVIGNASPKDLGPGTLNVQTRAYTGGSPIQENMMPEDIPFDDQGFLHPIPTNAGPLSVAGPFSILGPTPPVSPGTTALGITTTITVITTVGGIALPALASTFWVANVNGVAYGIPCFAL